MISKLEENLGDTDIKKFTVSPLYQIKCIVQVVTVLQSILTKWCGQNFFMGGASFCVAEMYLRS